MNPNKSCFDSKNNINYITLYIYSTSYNNEFEAVIVGVTSQLDSTIIIVMIAGVVVIAIVGIIVCKKTQT
ncbi:hypothetical protein EU528_10175 [Candidatus Thorarchaeota archaeon]|nr:MAG: hypothetical protein EU528_10175 [Candidatus Thorarchaeota archaeon]